jgi:hypothetical protein
MARYTRLPLLQPSLTLNSDNGEGSTNAATHDQIDGLPKLPQIPGKESDNPLSHRMPIHVSFRSEKEGGVLMSGKGDNDGQDPDDYFEDGPYQDAKLLADDFMRCYPPPPYCRDATTGNLPCPVIIPQRRPRDWKRGFMRAYAPVLGDCGISQDTFLHFLKTFDAVNKQLPLLQVINVAAFHIAAVPIIINCMYPSKSPTPII